MHPMHFLNFWNKIGQPKGQKTPKNDISAHGVVQRRSLGRISFCGVKSTPNGKLKEYLEIRQDNISNELS